MYMAKLLHYSVQKCQLAMCYWSEERRVEHCPVVLQELPSGEPSQFRLWEWTSTTDGAIGLWQLW